MNTGASKMKPLTEGKMRGGMSSKLNLGAAAIRPSAPPAPVPQKETESLEDLKKEIAFLQEQLWFSQEAMRKLMIELTNHLGAAGAEAIIGLMSEWSQIVHNINKDHGKA